MPIQNCLSYSFRERVGIMNYNPEPFILGASGVYFLKLILKLIPKATVHYSLCLKNAQNTRLLRLQTVSILYFKTDILMCIN